MMFWQRATAVMGLAFIFSLNLAMPSGVAQDYNGDGTPTISHTCRMNPGLCDNKPSDTSEPILDSFIMSLLQRGWDLRRQQMALQREYNAAAITFSRAQIQHVLGVWRGAYVCKQGRTGLTLSLDLLPDRSVQGVFNFYPIPEGSPQAPRGRYTVRLLVGDTHVFVEPLKWLDRPRGYSMVGMSGTLIDAGNAFAGEIQFDGCGNFALRKIK